MRARAVTAIAAIAAIAGVAAGLFGPLAVVTAAGMLSGRPTLLESEVAATVYVSQVGGGHGSGVAITPTTVLTADHVVEGAKALEIITSDGVTYPSEILWRNAKTDTALLRILPNAAGQTPNLHAAPVACRTARLSETITLIGNPSIALWRVARGTVASDRPMSDPDLAYLVPLDITASGGDSGGPVFDAEGNVIGLLTAGLVQSVGFGSAGFIMVSLMTPAVGFCALLGR